MTACAPLSCSILLLAGGRGQRMGGQDKGLLAWHGEPLIAHVQRVVRPLTDDLIISCNRNKDQYRRYADQLVEDQEEDFPGPLAGVRAGLAVARHDWLLVLACDAPLIDQALLFELMVKAGQEPVMVRQGEYWQPMFSLIPRRLAGELERGWLAGERSLLKVLLGHGLQALECAGDDRRLSNLNTPDLLR